jgi:hypothetical protein
MLCKDFLNKFYQKINFASLAYLLLIIGITIAFEKNDLIEFI